MEHTILQADMKLPQLQSTNLDLHHPESFKWSWALRNLEPNEGYYVDNEIHQPPKVGDVVAVRVRRISNHTKIMVADGGRLRLHENDTVVGVFGNRYATDAFEAETEGLEQLHIITNAGMIGTVRSKNKKNKAPTEVDFLGYMTDVNGEIINIKKDLFPAQLPDLKQPNVVLVVGSGMNGGKTKTAATTVKALLRKGLRVAACKLTGSVSPGDLSEFYATSANDVRDFSDYGLPSTYLCGRQELLGLFYTMLADSAKVNPDVVVMEIADGVLQQETKMLLEAPELKPYILGVILAATCSASGLFGISRLKSYGQKALAVSGVITNSPLYLREFEESSDIPVAPSWGDGNELADLIIRTLVDSQ